MIRVGLGYDLHALVSGRNLVLGGVNIPFHKGELGHSDGDVLLHAITDALLGASGLGDIGELFPPTDPQWKNSDSKQLLVTAWEKIKSAGWSIENIDCVIALQEPKFLPHRQNVRETIATLLSIETEAIFVKAKTGEGIGAVGEGLAVEAWVCCLLSK